MWSLCSVDFHIFIVQFLIQTQNSVVPQLQVFASSLEISAKRAHPWYEADYLVGFWYGYMKPALISMDTEACRTTYVVRGWLLTICFNTWLGSVGTHMGLPCGCHFTNKNVFYGLITSGFYNYRRNEKFYSKAIKKQSPLNNNTVCCFYKIRILSPKLGNFIYALHWIFVHAIRSNPQLTHAVKL